MRNAVIVEIGRSAIGRAPRGSLRYTRPEEIASQVLEGVIDRVEKKAKIKDEIEDLIVGCAMPEAEQGMNMARLIGAKANLPYTVPAQTINRFCSSGLQTIVLAAYQIMVGQAEILVAGGIESMSSVPLGGNRNLPDPKLVQEDPDYYMAMGHTAERVAEEYNVSREDQDKFAVESHRKAKAAQDIGRFKDEIIDVVGRSPEGKDFLFNEDEGIRPGTNLEGLSRLRPAFKLGGTVTAGNSSQTSDGASFAVLMSEEKAKEKGLKPIARFISAGISGVRPEVMGIGPIEAIPKALRLAGLEIEDLDLIELNEAFASQSIACIRELGLPEDKVNVNGGAIALGHPLGCTGAFLTTKLIYELQKRGGGYGLVSMCIGGGQGAAGVFEVYPK